MTKKGLARPSLPYRMPWWASILMAIVFYCALKYGIPRLYLTHPALQQLAQAAPTFAPILAIPWLLLAAKQLYDTDAPKNNAGEDNKHQEPPVE